VEQKRSALVSRRLVWMTPLQLSQRDGFIYEVLSAVVWCTEHAAVLVGRASAEKAHLAPRTALSHFIGLFLGLL
jgi:hypothetical protein